MKRRRKPLAWVFSAAILLQVGPCARIDLLGQFRDGVLASFSQFFTIFRD